MRGSVNFDPDHQVLKPNFSVAQAISPRYDAAVIRDKISLLRGVSEEVKRREIEARLSNVSGWISIEENKALTRKVRTIGSTAVVSIVGGVADVMGARYPSNNLSSIATGYGLELAGLAIMACGLAYAGISSAIIGWHAKKLSNVKRRFAQVAREFKGV